MSQFVLPKLEFAMDALAPVMSEETLQFHYGKHHQSYITNLNNLIKGTMYEAESLREIIKTSQGAIFNNASQSYNHAFFWKCLSPNGGGVPTGGLLDEIVKKWGSFDGFKEQYIAMAASNFGSGWTWLVKRLDGELEIVNTSNAGSPLTQHLKPLLVIDVWEHAYYIDYRNDRGAYLKAFFDKLVNWSFVEKRFNGEPCGCDCKEEGCGCAC
ncbi:MAG: Fe-Mn family superoxide dismutase [Sutterellaceae bacterium]|nr:Fe-Mn family superoxide dismutase [Sutterellaceae bacterium]